MVAQQGEQNTPPPRPPPLGDKRPHVTIRLQTAGTSTLSLQRVNSDPLGLSSSQAEWDQPRSDLKRRQSLGQSSADLLERLGRDRRQVYVCAFRGVRHVHGVRVRDLPEEQQEEIRRIQTQYPLLYTGHVGVSVDDGETIYGFGPIVPEGKTLLKDIVPLLKKHESFPGHVTDDTKTFEEAERHWKEDGWDTRVYRCGLPVSADRYETITERLDFFLESRSEEHGYEYAFPLKRASDSTGETYFHATHIANCATFPSVALGLDVPRWRGSLARFMRDMVRKAHNKTLALIPMADFSSTSDLDITDHGG